jgi:hypothetical protein
MAKKKAKKKAAPKTSKGKKKAAPRKVAKVARKKKAPAKRTPSRAKSRGAGAVVLEIAEVDVIGEPEEIAHDDEEFPPDYGGSE